MYEDITIKKFMRAWFNEDYSELSKEDYDVCYSEYIDTAGLVFTEEFDIVCSIHHLNNRINSIKLSVSLQKQFTEEFGVPYEPAFSFLRKFGYSLKWFGDKDKFYKDLDKISLRESKYEVELEKKHKQLFEARKKKDKGEESTLKQTREQFITMLNSLGKIGFKIDKNDTTVEELALMLKQQYEEQESLSFKYART